MSARVVPRLTYDTAGLPGGPAFGTRGQSGWPGFGGAFEVGGDVSRFFYRSTLVPTPRLTVSAIDISGQTYRRPEGWVRRDGRDQFLIQSTRAGGNLAGEAGGVPFKTRPGTVELVDFAVGIAQATIDTRATCLVISRDLFTPEEAERIAGPGWASAGGPIMAQYMESLLQRLPGSSAAGARRAEEAAARVLLACRTGDLDAVEEVRPELEGAARANVRRYVRANLNAPLDVATLAAAAGVSRATLHRLFAAEGGPGRFILAERLAAALDALLDEADRRSMTDIAQACGFADGAHFSRAFRERYGVRPSDLRPVG